VRKRTLRGFEGHTEPKGTSSERGRIQAMRMRQIFIPQFLKAEKDTIFRLIREAMTEYWDGMSRKPSRPAFQATLDVIIEFPEPVFVKG
jgi:hypothetical protein